YSPTISPVGASKDVGQVGRELGYVRSTLILEKISYETRDGPSHRLGNTWNYLCTDTKTCPYFEIHFARAAPHHARGQGLVRPGEHRHRGPHSRAGQLD